MSTISYGTTSAAHGTAAAILRLLIVILALWTAAIHAQLGGLMFQLNALGYTTLALAMILPGPLARVRWLMRLALIGFALVTIVGWVLVGARFPLAYLDKAIEVSLVGALTLELWLVDGGPIQVARRLSRLPALMVRGVVGHRRCRISRSKRSASRPRVRGSSSSRRSTS